MSIAAGAPVGTEPTPLVDGALRAAVREIADALGERHWKALRQLKNIMRSMGREWCDERLREALSAHAAGTCLRADGQPRTLGGCFFWLAFEALSPELRTELFGRNQFTTRPEGTKVMLPQPPVVTEWNGEMSAAKLEVTLKINELPRGVFTVLGGHKRFYLDCGGRAVTVTLRPKLWAKLETAARDWPQWVASVTGQMGPATPDGFELAEPNVQVFERKAKPSATAVEVR